MFWPWRQVDHSYEQSPVPQAEFNGLDGTVLVEVFLRDHGHCGLSIFGIEVPCTSFKGMTKFCCRQLRKFLSRKHELAVGPRGDDLPAPSIRHGCGKKRPRAWSNDSDLADRLTAFLRASEVVVLTEIVPPANRVDEQTPTAGSMRVKILGRASMPTVPPLTLSATMIHEIPRGRGSDESSGVVLSADPTPLNTETDRFIREEMLQPSFATGREIVSINDLGSPVPQLMRDILASPDALAESSRAMAEHLHRTQRGGSAGVFLCARAEAQGVTRVVIMKAEHQEGMRLKQTIGENGEVVFEAEHLNELILGRKAQVFKIALAWISPESGNLVGLMVDRQNGFGYADYFLDLFLGFELVHQAEKLVEDFVKSMSAHINASNYEMEKKARYLGALAAVLESPTPSLNPASFIRDFIDPADRAAVSASMPIQVSNMEFRKDTTLVHALIGGLRVTTDNGVVIQANADAVETGKIEVAEDKVIVHGSPSSFGLGRAPR